MAVTLSFSSSPFSPPYRKKIIKALSLDFSVNYWRTKTCTQKKNIYIYIKMASWDQFGEIGNVVQLAGLNAVSLIGLIVKAASTARMHKQNCRQFAQHVEMIGNLLEQLKISEMKKYPETREPLERLEDALRSAYLLVNSCREKSYLYLMAMGWNIVYQFRMAQAEIDWYLRIIPLIALVNNARVKERLEEIQKDQCEYTLDEDGRQLQVAISKNDTMILKESISCTYPNLPIDKALEKEQEKLKLELQDSQANMNVGQCQVIERLIEVTENAANSVKETSSPGKSSEKLEPDKGHFSGENNARKYDVLTSSREAIWQDEWHSDLLGCCSDPCLCIKTFLFPCGTISKIASVATGKEISSGEACNEIMAYTLILACCCYTCCMRRKLRRRLDIKGGLFDDFLSHFMCCCCALVQEWREVEIHGGQKTRTSPPPSQQMEF